MYEFSLDIMIWNIFIRINLQKIVLDWRQYSFRVRDILCFQFATLLEEEEEKLIFIN